ncbi:MAG: ABC transporter permease [Gemmatimonadales bacterium]
MVEFLRDVRQSLRLIRRAPVFSAVVILTLAIGIGANTALYSVVRGVFLRPLPYGSADRLMMVWNDNLDRGWRQFGTSLPDFLDWRDQVTSFDQLSAFWTGAGNLTGLDRPERVSYATVSANLFETLGTRPELGRSFRPEEEERGSDGVVVVSHGFWQRALGEDPGAIGRTVELDGRALEVIGVAPAGFGFPTSTVDLWKPLDLGPDRMEQRGARWLAVVGSLAPGRTRNEGAVEMSAVAARLTAAYPATNTGWTISLQPYRAMLTDPVRPAILIAWAAAALILLIAAANVANLLLARATRRQPELAVRAALGAGHGRLVRQLITESLVFSVLGTVLGLLLAWSGLAWLSHLAPDGLPGGGVRLDGNVLLYCAGLVVLTGAIFGSIPAFRAVRGGIAAAVRGGGRGAVGGAGRLRDSLVVSQVALAALVLVGAGLTLRSVARLLAVDPGFETPGRVTAAVAPARDAMPERAAAVAYYREVMRRAAATPGIRRVGAVNVLPVPGGTWWTTSLYPEGREYADGDAPAIAARITVGDYFGTMGIPLLAGRSFLETDDARGEPVMVIDRTAAAKLWPGEDPIGRRVTFNRPDGSRGPVRWYRIVGIVGAVRNEQLAVEPAPVAYTPLAQSEFGHFRDWGMRVVAEVNGDEAAGLRALEQALASVRRDTPTFGAATMEEVIGAQVSDRRFATSLLAGFGLIALVLSGVGVAGVLATMVAERTREIGVRMALGADQRTMLVQVVRQGLGRAGLGLGLGLGGAVFATRLLGGMLYGVTPTDPVTYAGITLILLLAAGLAAALPAWRASRVDPMVALRAE